MPAQAWATMIVSGPAAIGVIVTWRQQNRADRRSEWWRRSAWPFERTFSGDDDQVRLGPKLLDTQPKSGLATRDDAETVRVIGEQPIVTPVLGGQLQPVVAERPARTGTDS